MKKIKFLVEAKGEDMDVDIEGNLGDLVNVLANAIYADQDIKLVVSMAMAAVFAREQEEAGGEDQLAEMFSQMNPTAQA